MVSTDFPHVLKCPLCFIRVCNTQRTSLIICGIKRRKSVLNCFRHTLPVYHKANQEAQTVYCTVIKQASVLYISVVFSNACRALSQCNIQRRLLYMLSTFLFHPLQNNNIVKLPNSALSGEREPQRLSF